MKKNMNKTTGIFTICSITAFLFSLLLCFSCNNNLSDQLQTQSIPEGKARLIINAGDVTASRSINPDSDEEILKQLSGFNLSGTGRNAGNQTIYLNSSNGGNITAGNITALYNKQILLDAGTWSFTLTAKLGTTDYISTISDVVIEAGKDNSVSFNLEPEDSDKDYGGLDVKLYFDKTNVSKVVINLYKTDNDDDDTNDVPITDDYTPKTITNSSISWDGSSQTFFVSYTRAINFFSSKIQAGEYRLVFDFYCENQILNSIPYIVHIAEGVTTTFVDTVDINDVFTITYIGNSVTPTAYIANGQTLVPKFTRKSEDIVLPRYNRQDRIFEGWYDSDGNIITGISHNSNKNHTITAHWRDLSNNEMVNIYVNPSATGHYGFSEEFGLESLEASMETISRVHAHTQSHDWITNIKGTLTGGHLITTSINASNVNQYAKSITLNGTSESEGGVPADILNGDFISDTENGAVLSLQLQVPVTLKNLKITGGKNSNSGDIKGGGIYIGSDATLILDDGALITGNTAETGAGIYCDGTLKIKGSAVVQATGSDANDIYLPEGKKILIAGELTGTAEKIAVITPAVYSTDTVVLEAETGSGLTLTPEIVKKFAVTPQVTGEAPNEITIPWIIDASGRLYKASVGDLLLSDGRFIAYDENRTSFASELAGGKIPVGVVYDVDENGSPKGILGIKNSGSTSYYWAKKDSTGYNTNFTALQVSSSSSAPEDGIPYFQYNDQYGTTKYMTGDFNGSDNWSIICNMDTAGTASNEAIAENYPAFSYVVNYGSTAGLTGTIFETGWYMPSVGELFYISNNKTKINKILNLLDMANAFGTYYQSYWTSSQSSDDKLAVCISFESSDYFAFS